jgi:hypothetical protein
VLFQITISGQDLRLLWEDGTSLGAGFIKNEYMLARSETDAAEGAVRQVRARLQKLAAGGGLALADLRLEVDEVVRSASLWKLVRPEGFVFFPDPSS